MIWTVLNDEPLTDKCPELYRKKTIYNINKIKCDISDLTGNNVKTRKLEFAASISKFVSNQSFCF